MQPRMDPINAENGRKDDLPFGSAANLRDP